MIGAWVKGFVTVCELFTIVVILCFLALIICSIGLVIVQALVGNLWAVALIAFTMFMIGLKGL